MRDDGLEQTPWDFTSVFTALVRAVVTYPSQAVVSDEVEGSSHRVKVYVNPDDFVSLFQPGSRTLEAFETVLKAVAKKLQVNAKLEIVSCPKGGRPN